MLTNWFFFVRTRKKKHIEEQSNLKAPNNVDDVLSFAFNFAIKVEKRTSFKYNETNIFLATPKKVFIWFSKLILSLHQQKLFAKKMF